MKIGLIAMSGIRACDQELLELGLTLPGFVERSKTIASLPSLGLMTLAGMTPPEHEIRYLEVAGLRDLAVLPGDLDLAAISTFTAQAEESYELARRIRDQGTLVVLGGLHATSLPAEVLGHGISAAAGEGELLWPEILADARRGRLEPLYDARGRSFDLRRAPMPAFELLEIERYNRLTVQASRGCPWRCSFCASSVLLTSRYKQKPLDLVLAEVDRIRELWPRPFLELADDNAFVHRSWWRRFLPELAKRRVRWFAETDLSVAEDEELLDALCEAGCAELLVGIESPVLAGLDGLELKANWKRAAWPRSRDAVRRIQSHGIRVNACFVLGLDGHTPAVFDAVADFVEDAAPFDVQITYPTPFPGTPLYETLKHQGRLAHHGEWRRWTLFDINFHPAGMSREELRRGFHELARRLYSETATRTRHERFRELLRRAAPPRPLTTSR